MNEGVLEKYTGLMESDHAFFRYDETGQWLELFEALAAEVRVLRAERDEIKCKAVEQSEYIQSHGLTEFEMARLRRRVAELETDAMLGKAVREMPLGGILRHRNRCDGGWFYTPDCEHFWTFYAGSSPEAALEAARKEEE